MESNSKKEILKSKRRKSYTVFSVILIVLFLMIVFPPIVKVFDRNDIWIGVFPLSQVYIFLIPLLADTAMAILYFFDKRYTEELEALNNGGDSNNEL